MSTENTQWSITVHPSPGGNSGDGIITLPTELSEQLSGKEVPYTLEKDNTIILHITKITSQD